MCLPDISCHTIVYRAIAAARKIEAETGRAKADLFLRRVGKDPAGVSVFIEPSVCAASLNKCHGVVSLQAGFVFSLGLNIAFDTPDHGNMLGLPFDNERDPEARWKAGQLAKHCRYVIKPSGTAGVIWDRFRDSFSSEPVAMWHVVGNDPDPDEHWTAKFDDGTTQRINVAELAEGS